MRESGRERGMPRSTPGAPAQTNRKVDVRLPGKVNSNSHGARPVYRIISMIEWNRTSRLSIKNSLSAPVPDLFNPMRGAWRG